MFAVIQNDVVALLSAEHIDGAEVVAAPVGLGWVRQVDGSFAEPHATETEETETDGE
jgi:hypothetical protein